MKRLLSGLCATALAAAMAATSAIPLQASPLARPAPIEARSDIVLAQSGVDGRIIRREARQDRRNFRREARQDRREFRREARQDRREFRRDRNGFYNGYRGYREYRPGYRRQGDYWFPLAAFAAGALVTGAITNSQPRVVVRGSNSHVQWCYDRYRSYRASDNTFQPYNGGRQQCYSPYS